MKVPNDILKGIGVKHSQVHEVQVKDQQFVMLFKRGFEPQASIVVHFVLPFGLISAS